MPRTTNRRPGAAWALIATVLVAGAAHAASATLVAARLCRKTFGVEGRTYALKRMALIDQCADKLLRCELLLEIDGVDPTACRATVTAACTKRLRPDVTSALGKAAARFEAKTGAACETADFSYADVLSTASGGLWFGNEATCASSIDLPSFLACLRDELDARTDAFVSSLQPRAALLFDDAGLGAGFPHLVRPPLVDRLVATTAPGSGMLVDPGTIVVAQGSALRLTGDPATLPCAPSSNDGRVTITVGSGPTAQRHELHEPYTDDVAVFGPWIASGSIPYTIALRGGSCDATITGTVSVP